MTLEYVKKLARQDQASKYALGYLHNENSQFGIRMGSIFRMEADLADDIKDDENDDEFMSLTLDESFSPVLFWYQTYLLRPIRLDPESQVASVMLFPSRYLYPGL